MRRIRYAFGEDDMLTEVPRRLFTAAEYHQMARAGILRDGEPVELIDGEIVQMAPIGHRHWVCVTRASVQFMRSPGDKALVSIQGPLRLDDWTEPEPDIVVFKPREDFYAGKRPTPAAKSYSSSATLPKKLTRLYLNSGQGIPFLHWLFLTLLSRSPISSSFYGSFFFGVASVFTTQAE